MTTQFLPFGTAGGAPVLSNAAYAAIVPANGFPPGILTKEKLNKALRQANAMAAAIGQFISNAGHDALDDGNIPALTAAFTASLTGVGLQVSDFTGANQSLTDTGFQRLPGGLMFQWGKFYLGDLPSSPGWFVQNITFPQAYSSAVLYFGYSLIDANGVQVSIATIGSLLPTLTAARVSGGEFDAAAQDCTLFWFAVGF